MEKKPKHFKRFSPSKLEGLEQCPCFESEEIEASTEGGAEAPAPRGPRLHQATETRDLNLCDDESERQQVQTCIEYMDSMIAAAGPDPDIRTEMRVRVGDLTYGTLDFVVLNRGHTEAWLADWKYIRTPSISDARVNLQIATYCAGLLHRFKKLKQVHGNLVAPALGHNSEPVTFVRETLPAIEARIRGVIESANDPFKKPRACDMCAKCQNASRCPAMHATVATVANCLGLPMPEQVDPMTVTPLARAKIQVIATAAEKWAEQWKKTNNEYARAGGEVPGHITAHRAGNISVESGARPIELMQESGLLSFTELFACCRLKITDAIKQVMENRSLTKEDARNLVLDTLGEYAKRSEDIVYLQRQRSIAAEEILRLDPGVEGEENA